MEVKPGYKQTEIGVIPEDWETKTYGEVFRFLSTASYSRDALIDNGDIRYIHYGDIHTKFDGYLDIINSNLPCLQTEQINSYALVKTGDVIMVDASEDYSGIGKSVEVINNCNVKAIAGLHTYLMRDTKLVFVDGFRAYIYAIESVKKQFDFLATGMKVFGVSKNNLKKVVIPVPLQDEQIQIADYLADIGSLIKSLEKLIEKKKNIKQGVMQELLTGKRRLPGFSGEWVVKSLSEIGEITGGGVDKKSRPNEDNIRLVNYLDVYKRDFIYSRELAHYVTASSKQIEKCKVMKGDVFFTPSSETREDIGISALATEDISDACYSYHVVRLRFNEEWNHLYKGYAFKTREFLEQAETLCEGSGKRYVLTLPKFRALQVRYPVDIDEQEAIADSLFDLDKEIQSNEAVLYKYRFIKDGMMQELLTGRIRLI